MKIIVINKCGECPLVRYLKKDNGKTVCQHPGVMSTKPYNTHRVVFADQDPPDWCPLSSFVSDVISNTMMPIKSEELI